MLKELFEKKQMLLDYFFKKLDLDAADKFLQILLACKGNIIFTGIGKSGLVAKKIAVTMTSTGSKALYLSPSNALHGDIGILNDTDVFVMLSKSGETDELFSMIPFLRNKGVKLLGIVSNGNSRLAKACDFAVTLPLEQELCPFNLAPTTSTVIQMIFGDVMAIALMRHQNFTLDQYVLNHPAGSIGKRMTLKVKDLMLTGSLLPLCRPEDKLLDTIVELSNKRCGCVMIVDADKKLHGIFTDGDLSRALLKQGAKVLDLPMHQLMTPTARCLGPQKMAWDAMKMMEADPKNAITCMPVIDEQRILQGLIRLHDIVQSGL